MRTSLVLMSVLAALVLSVPAQADTITLNTPATGTPVRTAILSEAVSGYGQTVGPQQPDTTDLESYFGAGTWTRVGDKFDASGPDGAYNFDAILDAGDTWGEDKSVDGDWSFDATLWRDWGQAVITIHVGGGEADPDDHFAWMIVSDETSGSFAYDQWSGSGGGFSNMQLWVRGTGSGVPEPATGLLLLGALAGLVGLHRRRTRS